MYKISDGKKNILCAIALVSCGYGIFSDSVVVPLLTSIYSEFPDTSVFLKNFIVTGGYLFSLVAALITGFLMKKVDKKTLLFSGMLCFTLGGVGGFFSTSMEFLAVTRVLDGISDGVLTVTAMSMIAELYREEKKRAFMVGIYNGVSAAFGVLLSLFAGIIVEHCNWRYAFLLNAVSLVSLILILLAIPRVPVHDDGVEKNRTNFRELVNVRTCKVYFEYFISSAWYCILFVLVDLYVNEKQFGGSVLSGSISSISSVVVFVTGLIFSAVYMKMKGYTSLLNYFALAVTFLSLYLSRNVYFSIGMFILGAFSYTMLSSFYQVDIINYLPKESVGSGMGIMNAIYNLGCFISAYIPYAVMSVFKVTSFSVTLMYLSVPLFGITLFIIAENIFLKKAAEKNKN